MRTKKQDTLLRVAEEAMLMDYLISKLGGMKRNSVKSLLAHRQVWVNGSVQTRYDTMLHSGDTVTIQTGKGNIELVHPKLKVLYEDEDLIVVDKKRGLLTVPTIAESKEMTALSILKAYVKKQHPRNSVFVVHRLDRETSGVLVFAKSAELQQYMRTYWRELVTDRTYIAVAEGYLDKKEGTVKSWFTEDKRHAMVYSSPVDDGGDLAVTHYKVLRENKAEEGKEPYSLVELHLETGRTNQIRVHLASLGHPIVGDRKYGHGNEQSPIDRLCLHAKVLEFIHPVTEKKVHFETPVPKEFNTLLR